MAALDRKIFSFGDQDYYENDNVNFSIDYGMGGRYGPTIQGGKLIFEDGKWFIQSGERKYSLENLTPSSALKLERSRTPTPRTIAIEEERERVRIEQQKKYQLERDEKLKKEAEEDRLAEIEYEKIPCSRAKVNIGNKVLYNEKNATVKDILYEIEYDNKDTEIVKCDENLINVTYAIQQNKDRLSRQRNPRGDSGWWNKGGTKRKNKRYTKRKLSK